MHRGMIAIGKHECERRAADDPLPSILVPLRIRRESWPPNLAIKAGRLMAHDRGWEQILRRSVDLLLRDQYRVALDCWGGLARRF